MSVKINFRNAALLVPVAAVLVACGGGGGGDGGGGAGSAAIAASSPITVNQGNAAQVAATSIEASDGLTGSTEGFVGVVPASSGYYPSTDVNIVETIVSRLAAAPGETRVRPAAVQTQSEACETGSLSMTFNDADNSQTLTTGDSMSMTASACSFGGVSMNGSVSINSVVVTGDEFAPPYSLQFSLQTSGFSVSSGSESVSITGDGTIAQSLSLTNESSTFSGNGIRVTTAEDELTLTNYRIAETQDSATLAYSVEIDATISSAELGGSVQVTTLVPLTGVGDSEPENGQLRCAGDNSSVTVSLIDWASYELSVDEDGDGIAEIILMESRDPL